MNSKKKGAAVKKIISMFLLLTCLFVLNETYGRGQSADDCPPGSTDPDCKK